MMAAKMGISYFQVVSKCENIILTHFIPESGEDKSIMTLVSQIADIINNKTIWSMHVYNCEFSENDAIAATKAIDSIRCYTIYATVVDKVKEELFYRIISQYNDDEIETSKVFDFWWSEEWY